MEKFESFFKGIDKDYRQFGNWNFFMFILKLGYMKKELRK